MLILAEGTIHRPVEGPKQLAARAWLGPMIDPGFLQAAYHDSAGNRILLILARGPHQRRRTPTGRPSDRARRFCHVHMLATNGAPVHLT